MFLPYASRGPRALALNVWIRILPYILFVYFKLPPCYTFTLRLFLKIQAGPAMSTRKYKPTPIPPKVLAN